MGDYEAAAAYAKTSRETAASDDQEAAILASCVEAKLFGRRGERDGAHRAIRRALEMVEPSGFTNLHADVVVDQAEVLQLEGRSTDSMRCLQQAIKLYEAKGNVASSDRARKRLGHITKEAQPG